MILLNNLRAYIADHVAIPADKIFTNFMPASPDDGVSLIEYGGQVATGYGAINIQVNVRKLSNTGAHDASWAIFNLFAPREDRESIQLGDQIAIVNVKQPPFKRDVDDAGRTTYTFNMTVVTRWEQPTITTF